MFHKFQIKKKKQNKTSCIVCEIEDFATQLQLTWMPYVSLMWVLMAVMPPGKHPKQQFSPYLFAV